jgi:hypothetical protein
VCVESVIRERERGRKKTESLERERGERVRREIYREKRKEREREREREITEERERDLFKGILFLTFAETFAETFVERERVRATAIEREERKKTVTKEIGKRWLIPPLFRPLRLRRRRPHSPQRIPSV